VELCICALICVRGVVLDYEQGQLSLYVYPLEVISYYCGIELAFTPKGDHLGDQSVDGRVVLKLVLRNGVRV
jgi:hypothetical protein